MSQPYASLRYRRGATCAPFDRTAEAGFSRHPITPVVPDRLQRRLSDWEGGH